MYGARMCPYTHRAYLAIAHHNAPVQPISVDLKDKSAQFTADYRAGFGADRQSDGSTPCLVYQPKAAASKQVFIESDIVMNFIDDTFGTGMSKTPQQYADM